MENIRGVYGLPQADITANNLLIKIQATMDIKNSNKYQDCGNMCEYIFNSY